MDIRIKPSPINGKIKAIPSKSDAHRLIIAALLSQNETEIHLPSSSDDIDATIECIRMLGADVQVVGQKIRIKKGITPNEITLDCHESGSTLRFIVPVASVLCDKVSFTGRGRLPERPLKELLDALRFNGASFSSDKLPLTKTGQLKSGTYELPGNVSSQYVTGLLFALPLLDGESVIRLTSKLESSAYIDITLSVLSRFGIEIKREENTFLIKGNQKYISPETLTVDGDWSNASYFLASGVTVEGLDISSPQGDSKILGVFEKMGAKVTQSEGIQVDTSTLSGCEIDISEIPDTFPTLAVLATKAKGKTVFTGGARLRIKESDRIETTAAMLRSLGAKVEVYQSGMAVYESTLHGGKVDGAGDHRIVMAAALASTLSDGDVTIHGAEAVNKSYPSFFEDFKKLGGKCHVI